MLYWLLKSVVLGPLLRVLFRPRVDGVHHVPRYGPAILASNHLSFSDSLFLPLVLERRITFPAKMEYFTDIGIKGRLKALFFRSTGQIPIDRTGGQASRAAIDAGLAVLSRGELFGIYPEGTRSPDGRLYRGKTGVARMAIEAGAPIIPVAMIGTDKAQPTGQKIPKITFIGVRFGTPVDVSPYVGRQDDRVVLRAVTDEVMASLQKLSGQEYVDEYAASRKALLAARAEELMAAARAESAQARAKAEELVATARHETAQARARAEELMATARTESAQGRARAEEIVAAAVDRARSVDIPRTRDRAAQPLPDAPAPQQVDPGSQSEAGGAVTRSDHEGAPPGAAEAPGQERTEHPEGRRRADDAAATG